MLFVANTLCTYDSRGSRTVQKVVQNNIGVLADSWALFRNSVVLLIGLCIIHRLCHTFNSYVVSLCSAVLSLNYHTISCGGVQYSAMLYIMCITQAPSTQADSAHQAKCYHMWALTSSTKITDMDLATNSNVRSMPVAFVLLTSSELICDLIPVSLMGSLLIWKGP